MNKGFAVRWMMLFSLWFSPFVVTSLAWSSLVLAAEGPQTFTIDGRIKQAGTTTPILDALVEIEVHVMDPSRQCVIYAEKQTVNTLTSNGYFNIQVGSNVGAGKRVAGVDPGLVMSRVFSNAAAMTGTNVSGQTCPLVLGTPTYTPTTKDQRYFRIFVTPSATSVTDTLADVQLDAVPTAMVADTAETANSIGGFGPADLLRVRTTGGHVLTQVNLENIFTSSNYTVLTGLLAGTSPLYNKPAANGTSVLPAIAAPSSPAAGQIWYNAGNVYFHDGSVTRTISTGSSSSVSAANGSAAAPSISFSGDTDTGWYLAGADNLAAATGGIERVRINENGNLGVGSATPDARLTLGGAMTAPAWTSSGIGIRQNSATYTDSSSSGTVGFNYVNAFGVPTLASSAATTYTNASSFSLYPPVPGTNVTLTNSTGLTVNASALPGVTNGYGIQVNAPTGATNNYAATFMGGNVGIGTTAPTAALMLKAGTAAAGTAPLKLTAGPVNTTAEAGAIEFDGTSLFYTDSTNTRRTLGVSGSGITALTGEVTTTGSGSVAATITAGAVATGKIADDAVTFAKMQNIATQTLVGRSTAAAGDPEALTVGTGLTITGGALNLVDTADDDSFATLLGVCGNGYVPFKTGGVWTCLEATDANTVSALVRRDGAGSFTATQATLNNLRLNNAGSYVNISTPLTANYNLTLPIDDGTANQVLQTDGSGVLTWTTITPGVGDFLKNGTVDMTGTLKHVAGTEALPGITFAGDTNNGIYAPAADNVAITTNGTEKMRVLSNGNVGIGTTAPNAALEVLGKGTANTGTTIAEFKNTSGGSRLIIVDENATGTRPSGIYSNTLYGLGLYTDTAPIKMHTANSERVRIDSSGDVGIGTTAPAAKLDVNGAVYLKGINGLRFPASDSTAGSSIAIGPNALQAQDALASGVFSNISMGYNSMSSALIETGAQNNTAIGRDAIRDIRSGIENVAIGNLASANLTHGIRNTSVGYQSLTGVTIGFNNTALGFDTAMGVSNGSYTTAVGATALMFHGGSGNTAVGAGAISSGGSGSYNTALGVNAGSDISSGDNNTVIGYYPTPSVGITTGSNNILMGYDVRAQSTTGSNQLNIGNLIYSTGLGSGVTPAAGGVGIGTTAPTAALMLKAGTATAGTAPLKLTAGTNLTTPEAGAIEFDGTNLYYTNASNARQTIATSSGGSFTNVTSIANSGGNILMSPAATTGAVTIDSGTTSSSSTTGALIVTGGAGVSGNIFAGGTINAGTTLTAGTSAFIPQIYGSASASGTLKLDGTSDATKGHVLLNSAGGNVGIGTTAPTSKLDVTGTFAASGSATFGSGVGVGAGANSANQLYVQSNPWDIASGDFASIGSHAIYNGTANNIGRLFGNNNTMQLSRTGTTNSITGNRTYLDILSSLGATNIITGNDVYIDSKASSNTGAVYGLASSVANNGSGTIADARGLFVKVEDLSAGAITTGYGVYIDPVVASTSYGVYQAGASNKNYFAGNVGIGTTSPTDVLEVNGNIRARGQIFNKSQTITGGVTNTIDWNDGNNVINDYDCGSSISFANFRDGGTYTLVITGTGTAQCNFSTTSTGSDAAAGTLNYRFKPTNGLRTGSSYTVYTFMRIGTVVMVSWASGF